MGSLTDIKFNNVLGSVKYRFVEVTPRGSIIERPDLPKGVILPNEVFQLKGPFKSNNQWNSICVIYTYENGAESRECASGGTAKESSSSIENSSKTSLFTIIFLILIVILLTYLVKKNGK